MAGEHGTHLGCPQTWKRRAPLGRSFRRSFGSPHTFLKDLGGVSRYVCVQMFRFRRRLITTAMPSLAGVIASGCLLLWATLLSGAADDPTRFLSVTNWYATFTHSLNVNGTLDYMDPNDENCSANWR